MTARAPGTPWRPLAALAAVVLGAHLLFLQVAAPLPLGADEPRWTRPLVTRTITPPQAAPTPTTRVARIAPTQRPGPARTSAIRPAGPAPQATAPAVPVAEPTPANPAPLPEAAASAPAATVAAASPEPAAEPLAEPAPPAAAPPPRVAATHLPGSRRLLYTVVGQQGVQPLGGVTAELLWRHDGEQYEARLAFKLLFSTLRSQASTGRITPDGLAPERFSDRRRSEVAAHFERDKGRISFSGNQPEAPLMAGAQDRLSLFFQLAGWLAGQPQPPALGTRVSLQTAGPRDASVWEFVVDREETLQLPIGETPALRLVRDPRPGTYEQKVEAWFAPGLDWLPVRLRVTDANGDVADQRLRASEAP